jgi:hypothetical protein
MCVVCSCDDISLLMLYVACDMFLSVGPSVRNFLYVSMCILKYYNLLCVTIFVIIDFEGRFYVRSKYLGEKRDNRIIELLSVCVEFLVQISNFSVNSPILPNQGYW